VEGTVQRITPYGAFLQLEDGKIGLVHISEIDRNYVRSVEEHLRLNDKVQAKVVAIKEDGKIDLSIKALQDPAPRIDRRSGRDPEFEQKLKRFMRQSEERQVDFKRSDENKRKRDRRSRPVHLGPRTRRAARPACPGIGSKRVDGRERYGRWQPQSSGLDA
jgi:S1 RNA binding domain protein